MILNTIEELDQINIAIAESILSQSQGIFDRKILGDIAANCYRKGMKDIIIHEEIDYVSKEVHKFIDKFTVIYSYVIDYQFTERLTIELVDKLYSLRQERLLWLDVFNRDHNVQLVDQEIRSLLKS